MATFKTISSDDIKETTSVLNQLVDFVEEDVSGSATRKKFQVFVTSSGANAVTSSLFQTVYDQDFKLQTANARKSKHLQTIFSTIIRRLIAKIHSTLFKRNSWN